LKLDHYPDLRLLAQNAKGMVAALRFRRFKQWGVYIHHDEGTYLAMDPPGQSDDDLILPEVARNVFLEGYRKTIEQMDFMAEHQFNRSGPEQHSL
jgi:hypothetical protein